MPNYIVKSFALQAEHDLDTTMAIAKPLWQRALIFQCDDIRRRWKAVPQIWHEFEEMLVQPRIVQSHSAQLIDSATIRLILQLTDCLFMWESGRHR